MNRPSFTEVQQRELTKTCADTGIMLLQYSAESALVESVTRRMGKALGADAVEVALMANAITVTTLCGERGDTTVRRNLDRGINMQVVTEVQHTMLEAEKKSLSIEEVQQRLADITPYRYNRWLVVVLIGLSCACFARLATADFSTCVLTFFASGAAMFTRQVLAHLHFNPLVSFAAAAFVATSIAAQGLLHDIVGKPNVAMAASVLLLVPGFPLINSISDMVKGYVNTGIARGTFAIFLCLATCIGILLSMTIWNAWSWIR